MSTLAISCFLGVAATFTLYVLVTSVTKLIAAAKDLFR